MQLSREDLENIALGRFSRVVGWQSEDFSKERLILPNDSYLFIDHVIEIKKDPPYIKYVCLPSKNSLLCTQEKIMPGIFLEFFQGYMLLADFIGCVPKSEIKLIHRAIGGKIIYRDILPKIQTECVVEVWIDRILNMGKTKILIYHGEIRIEGKVVLEVQDFRAIFYKLPSDDESEKNYEDNSSSILQTKVPSNFFKNRFSTFQKLELHNGINHNLGLIKAFQRIHENDWYFRYHFINDPCMPGSLVTQTIFDICNFEFGSSQPILNNIIHASAKNHILPKNQELIYNLHIKQKEKQFVIFDSEVYVNKKLAFVLSNLGVHFDL